MTMSEQSYSALRRTYKLTRREIEVLDLIAAGYSNKTAAAVLSISPRTVEVHRARAMLKLDVPNTAMLALKVGALSYQMPDAFPHAAALLPHPQLSL